MVTTSDAAQLLLGSKNNHVRQERPRHLKYLNEFRTQQCLLFLEQQCQFHRPYTCFHWHFPNQKRRRPYKRSDGTFSYNPDVYCDKYDETSGSCVDGDDCPYAHRNAGDTERRYHPRYFKTGNCIYETTDTGACVKNGLHCAFAHGPDDIRLPVYDIREIQDASSKFTINLPASLEKERVLSEDPKWNEMFHVLACYKTESCKKPPRMCRQGYSCPFYHNGKDKRRAPDAWRYRSTPCPAVRPGDEWQDSSQCEAGDACPYCHTRTEQQFHPEIYKSTKCNDVINSGYCPRGPFCAFAHCDSELTAGRDFMARLQQDRVTTCQHHFPMSNATEPSQSRLGVPPNVTPSAPNLSTQSVNSVPSAATIFQRNPCQMIQFLSGDVQAAGFTDLTKRTSQVSASILPNLVSSLGQLGSPTGTTMAGAGRGRRVGRCASPQHIGVWQSPVLSQAPCERGGNSVSQVPYANSTGAFHPPSALSPTGSANQHPLQIGFYRQQASIRGGRHRSGSSISSEGGCPSSLANRDVTPPSLITGSVLSNMSTYPGRCGNFATPISTETLRFGTSLVTTHSKSQHRQLRNTPRKQPILQQQQPPSPSSSNLSMFSHPTGIIQQPPQRTSTTAGQAGTVMDFFGFSQSRPIALSNDTMPLMRGDIWTPIHPISVPDTSSDQLPATSWSWKMLTDSGNNSETSITEIDAHLFDFVPNSSGHHNAAPFVSSTLLSSGSNRDSGLVLDFSLSASNNFPDSMESATQSRLSEHTSLVLESIGLPNQIQNSLIGDDLERFTDTATGFQSPLDDILFHRESGFECLDQPSIIPNARSSPLITLAESNPVAIPRHDYELLEPDCSAKRDRSLDNLSHIPSHVYTAPQSQCLSGTTARPGQQNTWPVSFADIQDDHRARRPTTLSSPANSQISQSFSPIVGAPLSRTNQKPMFELGSDGESSLVNAARSGQVSATTEHRPIEHAKDGLGKSDGLSSCSPPQKQDSLLCSKPGLPKRSITKVDFNNLPQSPILISSPFSNPVSELERLSLQKELDDIRQRLGSKESEVEVLRKQRDSVAEHLRGSLDVIRQLFDSLNVSAKDVSKPLFIDTTAGGSGSGQSTGFGFTGSELSPAVGEDEEVHQPRIVQPDPNVPTQRSSDLDPDVLEKTQLQQQQEALAALFSNPLVAALLKSNGLPADSNSSCTFLSPPQWNAEGYSSVQPLQSDLPSCSVLHKLQPSIVSSQGNEGESD